MSRVFREILRVNLAKRSYQDIICIPSCAEMSRSCAGPATIPARDLVEDAPYRSWTEPLWTDYKEILHRDLAQRSCKEPPQISRAGPARNALNKSCAEPAKGHVETCCREWPLEILKTELVEGSLGDPALRSFQETDPAKILQRQESLQTH